MNAAFLDTVGLIALWNKSDQWHDVASRAFAELIRNRTRLITTGAVLLECGNAASRSPFRTSVLALRDQLLAGADLFDPTPEELEQAWEFYGEGQAGEAGIVDHISFVIMRRLRITKAFTNDAHFRAAGFEVLFQVGTEGEIRLKFRAMPTALSRTSVSVIASRAFVIDKVPT